MFPAVIICIIALKTTTPICLFNIISLNAFDVAQMSFLLFFVLF